MMMAEIRVEGGREEGEGSEGRQTMPCLGLRWQRSGEKGDSCT